LGIVGWEPAQANGRREFCRAAVEISGGGARLGGTRAAAFWALVSNLPDYAATGVKAQVFVLVLFEMDASDDELTQQYQNVASRVWRYGRERAARIAGDAAIGVRVHHHNQQVI
jgi:hypothetical protein